MTNTNMTGKNVLITGANSGIGKETAKALAQMGAHIIMLCRSQARGEAARSEIIQDSGSSSIDLLIADLSLQSEVRRIAAEIRERYDRLDVLNNNAGAFFNDYQETEDGIERTFALNHLAYFLLTEELLDLLKATPGARIVNVSSGAHYPGHIHFEDVNLKGEFSGMKAYGQSKLANVLHANELDRRLTAADDITVNSLHPGFVGTNFGKNNGGFFKVIMALLRPFAKSEEKGAETSIYLCASPDVADVSGKYFDNKQVKSPSEEAQDPQVAQRLWELSEELVGLRQTA